MSTLNVHFIAVATFVINIEFQKKTVEQQHLILRFTLHTEEQL